jgi:hypothetical protein
VIQGRLDASTPGRRAALILAAVLLCVGFVAPAHAQGVETKRVWPGQWLTSYIPFVAALPNDGPTIEWRMRRWQMANYDDRVTHNVAFNFRGAYSPWAGSWLASVGLSAPRLGKDWRLAGELQAGRAARFGYYGLGNVTDRSGADGNRVSRNLYALTADLTGNIAGPLGVSVQVQGARAEFRARDSTSAFEDDFGESLGQWETSVRLALVLDLRDKEYDTRSGFAAEFGVQQGYGAGDDWQRWHGVARGWLPVTKSTVVAARVFGADISGVPTLYARQVMPAWEQPFSVLGGEDSHRAVAFGRFTGTGVLGTNLEVRQMLFGRKDLGGVGIVAYADAGRVFEGEALRFTTDDWTLGGGGGIVLKALRGNVFLFTVGFTEAESHVGFRTGWMF